MIIVDRAHGRVKVETQGEGYELMTEAAMAAVEVARKVAPVYEGFAVRGILELIAHAAIGIDAALCTTDGQGGDAPGKT